MQEKIMTCLKGTDQHHVVRVDYLHNLVGIGTTELENELKDLQQRGAINRLLTTKNGVVLDTVWATGAHPLPAGNKVQLIGNDAGHNAQQDAEMSRVERRPGAVQDGIIAALEANGGWMDAISIFKAIRVESTERSTSKLLAKLAGRGDINSCVRYVNSRHKRFFATADNVNTDFDLPENVVNETDEDMKHIIEPVRSCDQILDHVSVLTNSTFDEIKTDEEIVVEKVRAKKTRYSYHDDDSLEIWYGDDCVILPADEARQLMEFADRIRSFD